MAHWPEQTNHHHHHHHHHHHCQRLFLMLLLLLLLLMLMLLLQLLHPVLKQLVISQHFEHRQQKQFPAKTQKTFPLTEHHLLQSLLRQWDGKCILKN